MKSDKSERSGQKAKSGSFLVQQRALDSWADARLEDGEAGAGMSAITMTAARDVSVGNIGEGVSGPTCDPGGGTASPTAGPPSRRPRSARMRFKEKLGGGDTCDVVNCKRPTEVSVRGVGWLCDAHREKYLEQLFEDWRAEHAPK